MPEKGKKPQPQRMQTRSSATSATTDDNESLTSNYQGNGHKSDNHNNVLQAMTDPGSSTTPVFKVRRDSRSESGVPEATSSKPQASPPSSIAGSSISSLSSGNTIRSGNIANNAVVSWILENYEERANSNVPRSGIYEHYKYYCSLLHARPVNAATFGKLIRVAFPQMSTRRLGNRGQSKYQYCNIQRRELPGSVPDTSGAISDVRQESPSFSMSTFDSSQPQHQEQQYQVSNTHASEGSSHNNNNLVLIETVQPTSLLSYQATDSASLSSQQQQQQQQRLASGFSNDNDISPGVDTRTHVYPTLQLPSPFGLASSSLSSTSSPPILSQHHLSNVELVSIFSPPATLAHLHDLNILTSPRPLASSSTTSGIIHPAPAISLLAGPKTPDSPPVIRRYSDSQDASSPTDQFAKLYNQHCQELYNAVCAGQFEKLQPIYDEFYRHMPSYYKSLVTTVPELTDSIWRWDCNLYDSFITDLLPKVDTHLSKTMINGLNLYTRNLPGYLQSLLVDYPAKLRNQKCDVACVFVSKLRRHLTLNHFAMKVGAILSQPLQVVEMKRDWQSLDVGTILDHVLWICDCRNDDMRRILKGDIAQLLNSRTNLDQWMDWVDRLVEKFVPRFPRIHNLQDDENYLKDAKQFVLRWKMYTSTVVQQLYLKNVTTIDSFKALQYFFDDLVLYRVEERLASVHEKISLRASPGSTSLL